MSREPKWIIVDAPENAKMPKWARRGYVDEEGEVFLPTALACNEDAILMAASWDGVPLLSDSGRTYGPLSWLAREYPQFSANWTKTEKNIPLNGDVPDRSLNSDPDHAYTSYPCPSERAIPRSRKSPRHWSRFIEFEGGSLDDRQIRRLARLGWVPLHLLRDILNEMLRLGLVEIRGPGRRFKLTVSTLPALDCANRGDR